MTLPLWIILLATLAESVLVLLVFAFFVRLRRSETLISGLQANQEKVLERIYRNAEIEQDLVESFSQRQEQLRVLNQRMEERAGQLQRLIGQAEGIARSPHFLREIILNGRRKGLSVAEIAKTAGLAEDEVSLILNRPAAS
jgi:uncharacterized protein HemX